MMRETGRWAGGSACSAGMEREVRSVAACALCRAPFGRNFHLVARNFVTSESVTRCHLDFESGETGRPRFFFLGTPITFCFRQARLGMSRVLAGGRRRGLSTSSSPGPRRGLTFLAQWLLGRVPNVSTGPQAWLCDAVHTLQSPLASVAAIRILLETEGCGVREHVWWRPRQLPVLQMQLGSCGHFCIQLQRGVAD